MAATSMFEGSRFDGDLSQWPMSSVESMSAMFKDSAFTGLQGSIAKWDTSRVRDMAMLFERSQFMGDVSDWNVGALVHAKRLFYQTRCNPDLSRWDVRRVKDANSMFAQSAFNGDLSKWRLNNAILLQGMFSGANFSGDVSQWRLNSGANVTGMFSSDFQGVLPMHGPDVVESYASMLKGEAALVAYLKRMPLGPVHFDVLVQSEKVPSWSTSQDHEWAKSHHAMGLALGMDANKIRASVQQGDQLRKMVELDGVEFGEDATSIVR